MANNKCLFSLAILGEDLMDNVGMEAVDIEFKASIGQLDKAFSVSQPC